MFTFSIYLHLVFNILVIFSCKICTDFVELHICTSFIEKLTMVFIYVNLEVTCLFLMARSIIMFIWLSYILRPGRTCLFFKKFKNKFLEIFYVENTISQTAGAVFPFFLWMFFLPSCLVEPLAQRWAGESSRSRLHQVALCSFSSDRWVIFITNTDMCLCQLIV